LFTGQIPRANPVAMNSEKGVELLADAFLAAHGADPRLHLVLAVDEGGPASLICTGKTGARSR